MLNYTTIQILLYIIAGLIPFGVALNPIAGVDLPLTRVLIALAGLVWLVHLLSLRNLAIARGWLGALVVGFLFLAILSIVNVVEPTWFLRKMAFLLNFFVLFFVIGTAFAISSKNGNFKNYTNSNNPNISNNSKTNLRKFLEILAISGTTSMLIGLILWSAQFVVGAGVVLGWYNAIIAPIFLGNTVSSAVTAYSSAYVAIGGQNYLRLVGTFPDPHMAAFFGEMLLGLVGGLALSAQGKMRAFWTICASIVLVATLATFTRGAYLGLATIGVIGGIYWLWHIRARALWIFGSATIALVLMIALIASPVGNRLASVGDNTDGSNSARWSLWQTATDTIAQNPLTGVGLGQYPLTYMPYADYRLPYYAHNLYLDIAVEIGIVGALIWILLIGLAIWRLVRFAQIYQNPLPAGLALGLIALSVHSIFDTPLFSVRVLPLIIIFLAIASLGPQVWKSHLKSV